MYTYKELQLITRNSSWWKQKKYRKESALILNTYRKNGWKLAKKKELVNNQNKDTRTFSVYFLKKPS